MKKSKQKNIIISVILIAVTVVIIWGLITMIYNAVLYSSHENAEKILKRNRDEFIIVAEYLSNYECASVSIRKEDEQIFVIKENSFVGVYEKITDKKVEKALKRLFSCGVKSVYRSENSIKFLRWTRLMDFGSGIVFSIDGNKPYVQFLTKLDTLSLDGWYYYEADYNEWRVNR